MPLQVLARRRSTSFQRSQEHCSTWALWYCGGVVAVEAGVTADTPRVLVVDDEPAIRRVLSEFLSMEGFLVDTAPDGRAAVSCLADQSYDVVISDLKMPRLGGLELLKEVNRLNPEALT